MSVRAVAAHDELHHEGESLVLVDGQVHRVSALGTTIRRAAADGPRSVEALTEVLEEEFGTPPEGSAHELTRRAVDALVAAGLLEVVEEQDAPGPGQGCEKTPV